MWALKRKIAAVAIGSLLKSVASEERTKKTVAGVLAAAVLAIPALDLQKLIEGDPVQIALVVSGVLIAGIGILAQRGKGTLGGAVAGSLYAVQGSVEAIITAVVIAILGWFADRPAQQAQPEKAGGDQEAGGGPA